MAQGAEGKCVSNSASSVPRSANETLTEEAEPKCSNNDLIEGSSCLRSQVQSYQNHVIDDRINIQDTKTTLCGKKRSLNDCHENTLHFPARKREVAKPDAPEKQVKPMDFSDIISSQVLSELRTTIEMLRQDLLECKLFHTLLDWVMSLHPKTIRRNISGQPIQKIMIASFGATFTPNHTLALVAM